MPEFQVIAPVSAAPPADEFLGHPKGLFVCFFTEMWERFSFYGMKALLLLYILKYHLFGDDAGYDLLGAYGGLVYAVPVIGGLLADRYLGMRKAVVLGGVLLVLGHLGMAYEGEAARVVDGTIVRDDGALQVFYLSLALIIMGVGFLKPNISTIVGIYAACVYLASLPGGWIADRWLGLRRSIWYGGILIACGHLSIAL